MELWEMLAKIYGERYFILGGREIHASAFTRVTFVDSQGEWIKRMADSYGFGVGGR